MGIWSKRRAAESEKAENREKYRQWAAENAARRNRELESQGWLLIEKHSFRPGPVWVRAFGSGGEYQSFAYQEREGGEWRLPASDQPGTYYLIKPTHFLPMARA